MFRWPLLLFTVELNYMGTNNTVLWFLKKFNYVLFMLWTRASVWCFCFLTFKTTWTCQSLIYFKTKKHLNQSFWINELLHSSQGMTYCISFILSNGNNMSHLYHNLHTLQFTYECDTRIKPKIYCKFNCE